MRYADSADQLIGNTPLLRLRRIEEHFGLKATLLAKIEGFNPGGSVKDRVAKKMLDDAEQAGKLSKNSVIIEPTSGNTGIGLAAVAASRGYRCIIVMPDTMSKERQLLMKAYGAEVVLSDGKFGMKGAIELAEKLAKQYPDSIIPGQFVNPSNPRAHYETTGPELWRDTEGSIDLFVAGIGTGGTITGTGRYLKEQKPTLKVIGIEPKGSAVLSGGKAGPHGLQGIGAGFVPEILDASVCDEIFPVTEEEAYAMARLLGKKEGILAGISSGAALFAAAEAAKRPENEEKTIVVLLPDTGERYLSTDLFHE
ncbi:MAG: cysteine synthase A [Clostridia bacterium]|nr:cysteine synthase A [Clostridia bacterium]